MVGLIVGVVVMVDGLVTKLENVMIMGVVGVMMTMDGCVTAW